VFKQGILQAHNKSFRTTKPAIHSGTIYESQSNEGNEIGIKVSSDYPTSPLNRAIGNEDAIIKKKQMC
jgi:hypothetical protein